MQNEKITQELIDTRNACGSRVVLDGKSCIAPINDKAFFDKCLMYSESKNMRSRGSQCLTIGKNDAGAIRFGFRILSLRRRKCFRKWMNACLN